MQSTLAWPNEQSRRIPGWVYTDPAIYAREQERIFGGRSWNYVGLTSEIPRPGDFLQTYVGEHPVVVVRDHQSRIRVFVNRCTHRGSQFCLVPHGHAEMFICPYHQWTFGLDGELKAFRSAGASAERVECQTVSIRRTMAWSSSRWRSVTA
jgi:salicylate 5-hydroxylase large subunit